MLIKHNHNGNNCQKVCQYNQNGYLCTIKLNINNYKAKKMTEKVQSKRKNVMSRIKELKVGEAVSFPIEWMDTVRVEASKANALFGGKRSTRMDVIERLIYVERAE